MMFTELVQKIATLPDSSVYVALVRRRDLARAVSIQFLDPRLQLSTLYIQWLGRVLSILSRFVSLRLLYRSLPLLYDMVRGRQIIS